jgi:hypothetical protein
MSSANPECTIEQIGQTAGLIWHALEENGPYSMTRLVKAVGVPRDTVILAVGWLAREGKIRINDTKRGRIVALCE